MNKQLVSNFYWCLHLKLGLNAWGRRLRGEGRLLVNVELIPKMPGWEQRAGFRHENRQVPVGSVRCSHQLTLFWNWTQNFQEELDAGHFISYPKEKINRMTTSLTSECPLICGFNRSWYNVKIWRLNVRNKHFHSEVIWLQKDEFFSQK